MTAMLSICHRWSQLCLLLLPPTLTAFLCCPVIKQRGGDGLSDGWGGGGQTPGKDGVRGSCLTHL